MENMECLIIKVHPSVILIKPFLSSQRCSSESYQKKMVAAIVSKTVDEQYSCVCDTGHVMHGL